MSMSSEQTATWSREAHRDYMPGNTVRRRGAQAVLGLGLLGLGLIQGYSWAPDASSSPVAYEAGALVATGELEQVLYDPALGGREEGPSAGRTFTNKEGHSCRPFSDKRVSGTACQRYGDWRVVELRQE